MPTFVPAEIEVSSPERIAEALAAPGFGGYWTDRVARAHWTRAEGWGDRRLEGIADLRLHPGTGALHYGQEIFEGLKAYRHPDGSIWLFRPEANAARFARSAERLAMAPLPTEDFLAAVLSFVEAEQAWVPDGVGEKSLYLRPLEFASQPMIAPHESDEYTFLVMATPAGVYYSSDVRLWVTRNFSRSAHGGTGAAKCGGNYAAAFAAEREAASHGCGQVLWLDSATGSLVEECGTMNFFVITADDELITPELTGTILPGVTRDSLLQLAPAHGLRPVERPITLEELRAGVSDGSITETFACGTAAVITPIVGFAADGWSVDVGDGTPGQRTAALRDHLVGIQFGTRPDDHGWLTRVC